MTRCPTCARIGMVYPFTAAVLALPFGLFPWPVGEWLYCAFGIVLFVGALHQLRVPLWAIGSTALLFAVRMNNPILLVTALSAMALVLQHQHPRVAGALVAIALLIKPQAILLIVGYILVYSRQRLPLVLTLATVILLVGGGSLLLQPAWIPAWVAQVHLYQAIEGPSLHSFPYILPVALWIMLRRSKLGGVALAQVALFPAMIVPYSFLPLTTFAATQLRRTGLLLLITCSWSWGTLSFYVIRYVPDLPQLAMFGSFVVPVLILLSVQQFLAPSEQ